MIGTKKNQIFGKNGIVPPWHSLAVCGSLCGEKQFLLIFIPIYLFDQKKLFKQIQIFLRIWPFQTW